MPTWSHAQPISSDLNSIDRGTFETVSAWIVHESKFSSIRPINVFRDCEVQYRIVCHCGDVRIHRIRWSCIKRIEIFFQNYWSMRDYCAGDLIVCNKNIFTMNLCRLMPYQHFHSGHFLLYSKIAFKYCLTYLSPDINTKRIPSSDSKWSKFHWVEW